MPNAAQSITIETPLDFAYRMITNYDAYPRMFPSMTAAAVEEDQGEFKVVSYQLSLFRMTFNYRLRLTETPPFKLTWSLLDSSFFMNLDGSWQFEPLGEAQTLATYTQTVKTKSLVPKSISTSLASICLPSMLRQFKECCETSYRQG